MNIYKKLQTARLQLQDMELKKTGYNSFSKYWYFELGDFLPQTQKLFDELCLCGTVSFNAELASLTVTDIDKPESQILFTSPMGTASLKGMHDIQNIGAVETYQRRYLWVAVMEIVEHDAVDAGPGEDKQGKQERKSAAKKQDSNGEADAVVIAQFNAAKTIQDLVVAMTAIPQEDKKLYTTYFNECMSALKKGEK